MVGTLLGRSLGLTEIEGKAVGIILGVEDGRFVGSRVGNAVGVEVCR